MARLGTVWKGAEEEGEKVRVPEGGQLSRRQELLEVSVGWSTPAPTKLAHSLSDPCAHPAEGSPPQTRAVSREVSCQALSSVVPGPRS